MRERREVLALTQKHTGNSWTAASRSQFLQRLADTVPNILYVYDLIEQRNIYCNQAVEEVLGCTPEQIQQMGEFLLTSLLHPNDRSLVEEQQNWLMQIADGEKIEYEYRIRHANGEWRWLHSQEMVFSRTPDGQVRQLLGSALDITDRKRFEHLAEMQMLELSEIRVELEAKQLALLEANAQLEALATTDGLTGLKNHRAFQEFLEHSFQQAARYKVPLSVLLLDVDKFKQYNDTFGHPAGDEVLKRVGQLLQEQARTSDFVARYGGEEFVLILPQTNREGALIMAERLRTAIETSEWPQRAITTSIGVATFTPNMKTRAVMIAEADAALYRSKQNGRNRVTHAQADTPTVP
jgi:diguanylate cyclase (GGDEF)-like protein/PAS domain S-box-containing protein